MKFLELAKLYEKLEKTDSYNEIKAILGEFFRKVTKDEIKLVAYLTLGNIAPSYSDINLGIAEKMALKSIALAANKPLEEITFTFKESGDLGDTARIAGKGKGVTVKELFESLLRIANMRGKDSQEEKIKALSRLLAKSSKLEAKYITRIVLGQLRLGVADKTALDGLIYAFAHKKDRSDIEHAYNICPDIGLIAQTILKQGMHGIRQIKTRIGTPIQMMLCQRIKTLNEISKRTGFPVAIEQKYDGERIQAHKNAKTVTLYSRRLENITDQFPELAKEISKLHANDLIVEGEAVAIDESGKILPFQTMMQRRRKHDIKEYIKKIPITLKLFDLLHINGKSTLKEPYPKRYELLKKITSETKKIGIAERIICNNTTSAENFFKKIVKNQGEGIVIKSLKNDSTYQAGVRGWHWIKWKPEYVKGMRDTFDLAVIGAYLGKGRRAGKYGAILCAVYDEKNDKFLTFCKVGTGFTDQALNELTGKLTKAHAKPQNVQANDALTPDVWITPMKVIEVAAAEITKSPIHTAGYALRFPRFIRFREKTPQQATSIKEILAMLKKK